MPGGVGVVGAALGGCWAGGGGGGGVRELQAGSFEVVVVWEALIKECFDCYKDFGGERLEGAEMLWLLRLAQKLN